MANDLKSYTLAGLPCKEFIIPYYQRGYRWTTENIETLLNDLNIFIKDDENDVYFMQPLAVIENLKYNSTKVVDGQQRLTTFYLIYKYLITDSGINPQNTSSLYKLEYDKDDDNCGNKMFSLIEKHIEPIPEGQETEIDDIDEFYVRNAYTVISKWFNNKDIQIKKEFYNLFNEKEKEKKSIQFFWYVIDNEDGHKAFQNINSNKIQLSNADLIKALLLSDTTGLENRYQIAAQFEEMERQFSDDKFWFMLSNCDVRKDKGQSRIDLLFNLQKGISGIKNSVYVNNPRITFNSFMEKSNDKDKLNEIWKKVRQDYHVLMDFFNDLSYFHYVGYLRFALGENFKLSNYICDYLRLDKQTFFNNMKQDISKTLFSSNIDDYNYSLKKKELQKIFVLHNIETILERSKALNGQTLHYFEYFPFELLYSQTWNIEHIDSQTLTDLNKSKDNKKDWLNSVFVDYKLEIKEYILENYRGSKPEKLIEILLKDDGKFNEFYSYIWKVITGGADDSLFTNGKEAEEKNQIGNLVLLDEHTNKSFHNSVFPRKRRIVLMASGLMTEDDEKNNEENNLKIQHVYVPICTKDIYTKAYNKTNNLKLNYWSTTDCEEYKKDIYKKLKKFFNLKEQAEDNK